VQIEHDKARHRQLSYEVEAPGGREPPEPPVAQDARRLLDAAVSRNVAEDDAAARGCD
jgi:hypothetical protein